MLPPSLSIFTLRIMHRRKNLFINLFLFSRPSRTPSRNIICNLLQFFVRSYIFSTNSSVSLKFDAQKLYLKFRPKSIYPDFLLNFNFFSFNSAHDLKSSGSFFACTKNMVLFIQSAMIKVES